MRRWVILIAVLCIPFSRCGQDSLFAPTKKANVVMIEGPVFVDGYSIFEYQGRVKNNGTATAMFTKVYVYLRRSNNSLIEQNFSFIADIDLASGEMAPWSVLFSDGNYAKRDAMDKSKTTYEILWNEK